MSKRIHASTCFLLLLIGIETSARTTTYGVCFSEIQHLDGAVSTFHLEYGRYPTQEEGLSALVNRPSDIPAEGWSPYIKQVPKDPWGNDYIYRYPGKNNTNSFDLYSLGQNGRSKTNGGDRDDINNWDQTQKWRRYYEPPWEKFSQWELLIICGIGIAVVSGVIFVWRSVGTVHQPSCPNPR